MKATRTRIALMHFICSSLWCALQRCCVAACIASALNVSWQGHLGLRHKRKVCDRVKAGKAGRSNSTFARYELFDSLRRCGAEDASANEC
eukprot:4364113-Pleurochrysis_carterae.AAC.7